MDTTKVYTNPTDDDLIIGGELLSIDIKYTSFFVEFQIIIPDYKAEVQFLVRRDVFPIKYLKRFFKVNSEGKYPICIRPKGMIWAE